MVSLIASGTHKITTATALNGIEHFINVETFVAVEAWPPFAHFDPSAIFSIPPA